MKIRWKLLLLLLVMALFPLLLSSVYSFLSARRLGYHLASQTRATLIENTQRQLQALINEYERIQSQTFNLVEAALRVQAREVERLLKAEPLSADRLFFSEDYDAGMPVPGLAPSETHMRIDENGTLTPLNLTYLEQVYFVVKGITNSTIERDMEQLASMPEIYRSLYDLFPDLAYWQYTALDVGFHTSYPGHGGYPDDYDPRIREWYSAARDRGALTWLRPLTEVSTRTVQLAVSMPVYRPDGSFAGVTAIDVPLSGLLNRLPDYAEWSDKIWTALVLADGSQGEQELRILADRSYEGRNQNWRHHPEQRYLTSENQMGLSDLKDKALSGHSGIVRMDWRGQDALWAYGAGSPNRAFAVVIIPYETIVGPAVEAEKYVVQQTRDGLKAGVLLVACMVAFASILAFNRSRKLTEPICQVASTAKALMHGDYDANVDIRTGDEIQELAEVVNQVGPALKERQRLQRSLELTMGIQQNLLPMKIPVLEGFDISATCVYSEETGGDYYDFMPLIQLGKGTLGFALGDVSGHGLPAAMLMASARGVLRSQIELFPNDLTRVFAALNRHFFNDTPTDRFMTLFFGILDGPTRTLIWGSGGQGPVYWLHQETGAVEELKVTGAGLGMLENATYEHGGPITLAEGDIVVVGTDGIWETFGGLNDEEYGEVRFVQLLKKVSSLTADQIRDAIIRDVTQFRGDAPQVDDITMIVIKA